MKVDFSKNKNGFTLIELLVVISIIGVLSSTVMVAVQDARNKANDKALLASAIQLRNALELYKEDHGGLYPGEPINRIYVSQSKNATGFYYAVGNPLYNDFVSLLSPYLSGNFMYPVHVGSNFQYIHADNWSNNGNTYSYKCTGQNKIPRYVILIQPKTSINFPTLTIMS